MSRGHGPEGRDHGNPDVSMQYSSRNAPPV
jgi:hypothetical protein